MRFSTAEIAQLINGELVGDGSVEITGCAGVAEARPGDIAFLANPKYLSVAQTSKAAALIVSRQTVVTGKLLIRVDNPSLAFTELLRRFSPKAAGHPQGIHPTAIIAPDAQIAPGVSIGAHAVVETGASIGEGSVLYSQTFIGTNARVGRNCLIYPQVVVREEVSVGNRVIIHSGSVIGSDGYGYVTVDGKHIKIPQTGTVVIEDDVEIGANVTIDRARFDKTLIGEGTKIDNLVQIAHNVMIGKHCLIVAQAGISGSTRLGNFVVLAGQVGVVGHVTIGDGAVVAAQSGVSKSIGAGEQVFGSPAEPIKEAYHKHAHVARLDHYVRLIKDLKKRIDALEEKKP